ncbi:ABC transporter related protein [Caldalkalibacillus thermarum TA2.A1]|uniref:ABC transporter ATP-binding protein n=1 Tax=Caldalkalibacillus thermarum (strain TA2.A1) TaxID=986075 RepID=F5L5S1_CALTT|nr:ABC transporter ATP-binding protein [Caldalkalibacillus thermarum]EGL83313.1 ABC transporter related protein [Caldalkalibacillus thermarum TA2.A1]QZT34092.1 ABC transporter ATP-binding protein [Caldalkalibacillus thermarum TA2.A1]
MRIELRNVSKRFDKADVIENLNMVIEDGEFVALLGPSGCGKSTTLLMLAGIYKPTKGDILFDGQIVNEVEPKDRKIGMLFQSYALYPHMTVLENIMFPLKQMKVPKKERVERAKEAAALVKLDHLLDRLPSELSGGQQQRVALARAVVKEPKLLLLDEPLSNLDARLKIEMREEIKRIQQELGITTVMVTHDQEEALTMADRVAIMKDGELVQYSKPLDLYHHPKNYFVAHFIGSPPMNFLKGQLSVQNDQLQFAGEGTKINLGRCLKEFNVRDGQSVYLGVRPHDLKLGKKGQISLTGVVNLTEPLGHTTLVNVTVGNSLFRFFSDKKFVAGLRGEVEISFDRHALHLFDASSGESLSKRHLADEEAEEASENIIPM